VQQRAGVGVLLLPETAQGHGRVAADAEPENRVVRAVEKGVQAGQLAGFAETVEQVVAVAFQRMRPKIRFVPVARQIEAGSVALTYAPKIG
jgi:hypothetical protein